MKIAVAGIGYVGLSIATLLSQKNEVVALDINSEKVDMVNKRIPPIKDKKIEEFFSNKKLNLRATLDYKEAFENSKYVIVSTPTNYDDKLNYFDTSTVEDIIKKVLKTDKNITIIIKSTVPVGFTESMKRKYNTNNIIFSPEFLREGKALYDNLNPSRIVIGDENEQAKKFAELLKEGATKKDIIVKYMKSTEAVKLFSNTYLALRVSYFNELDTYAELKGLNTKNILEGVCLDPRIGMNYNNPSFGYGGYCLPKDTKQLLANYNDVPQDIIGAIVKSNETRKNHIVNMVVKRKPKIVGIYRLAMKKNSDNFRTSAILDIIEKLKKQKIEVIIYEPTILAKEFEKCEIVNDVDKFISSSNLILTNRMDNSLVKFKDKIYTRDLFNDDI